MMASNETSEIQLDPVGAEAVQQTLDALGVQAEQVNAGRIGRQRLPQPRTRDTFLSRHAEQFAMSRPTTTADSLPLSTAKAKSSNESPPP